MNADKKILFRNDDVAAAFPSAFICVHLRLEIHELAR